VYVYVYVYVYVCVCVCVCVCLGCLACAVSVFGGMSSVIFLSTCKRVYTTFSTTFFCACMCASKPVHRSVNDHGLMKHRDAIVRKLREQRS